MKIKRHEQVSRLLQPDQRQKQNHNSGNLLIRQLSYRRTKESGLILSHQNQLSLRTISTQSNSKARRRWSNSILHLRNIPHKYSIGLISLEILFGSSRRLKKKRYQYSLTIREQTFTCKEYTSYYRKLAMETIQIQQEQRQKH